MSLLKSVEPAFEEALDRLLQQDFPGTNEAARGKMLFHYRLLSQWNRKINLTRVIAPADAARKHFGESLFLAEHLPAGARSAVDVGSGAGFPGLPVAATKPVLEVTCVESVGKKAAFLREVSRDWGNVAIVNRRIEDLSIDQSFRTFEWAVLRAVALQPLLGILASLAEHLAVLAAEPAPSVFDDSRKWKLRDNIRLPWRGSGVLLLADRL